MKNSLNYFDIERIQLSDDFVDRDLNKIFTSKLRKYIKMSDDDYMLRTYLADLLSIYLDKKIKRNIDFSFKKALKL